MPELRWILLILGLAFLGALAWWETKRQRRSPAPPPEEPTQRRFREPTLSLPEIRPREPAPKLPVVEIEDDSMLGLRVDGVRIEEDIQAVEPALEVDVTPAEAGAQLKEHFSLDPGVRRDDDLDPGFRRDDEAVAEPIVEWPPEHERRVLTVRVVAQSENRFPGRALRLALAAEGFALGKFSIFHKPGPDGRVVVSATSITQPGTFDAETMDTHRYAGLGLFTVMPGPLPDVQLFDELVAAARNLNERLEGALQDERGEPLTAARVALLRERLRSEPAS